MILHSVYLNLRSPHDAAELRAVMAGLSELIGEIAGFVGFEFGPNIDLEKKSQDYAYGFLCRFDDQVALERYAADPRHQALGGRLVALCKGGADGIMVFDLEIAA